MLQNHPLSANRDPVQPRIVAILVVFICMQNIHWVFVQDNAWMHTRCCALVIQPLGIRLVARALDGPSIIKVDLSHFDTPYIVDRDRFDPGTFDFLFHLPLAVVLIVRAGLSEHRYHGYHGPLRREAGSDRVALMRYERLLRPARERAEPADPCLLPVRADPCR